MPPSSIGIATAVAIGIAPPPPAADGFAAAADTILLLLLLAHIPDVVA
jgi:hypothetical protein